MADISATQTSKTQEWLTPLWLFDILNQEFSFDLDAAASNNNTLCDNWFTEKDNGLEKRWWGNVFLNFPYNQAYKWVEKARGEVVFGHANLVVLLAAARTDTRWWWNFVKYGEVRFLKGRLKFEHEDGARFSAPFPSAVVIFRKEITTPKTVYWEIGKGK